MASLAMQILSFLSEDNRQVDPRQWDHIECDRRFAGVQQPVVTFKLYDRVWNSEILFHQLKALPV